MLGFLDGLRDITTLSVLFRLFIAVMCGGIIGIEREHKRRPAGFRTHILICLGASMTTLTSQFLFYNLNLYTDIGRLGAQVVAGIGFIGAGFYECAVFGFLLILITTTIFNKLGAWVIANARNMDLYVEFDRMDNLGEIISTIKALNIQIFDVDTQREKQSNGVVIGAVISMGLPKGETHSHVMSKISKLKYVTLVDEI